jgi:hypothetical protein
MVDITRETSAMRPAAPASERPVAETVETSFAPFSRISWGGILAGVVIVLALQIVLNMVGVGIGLSTVEPLTGETPRPTSLGIGAGLWLVVSTWIALAAGSFVASRVAGSLHTDDALLHGLVTWGLTLIVGIALLSAAIGAAASRAADLAGGVVKTVGQAAGAPIGAAAGEQDLRQFVMSRIQPSDATRLSPEELDNTIVIGVSRLIANPDDPSVDRQRLVELVAARTRLSEQEASARLQEIETQARQIAEAAKQRAREAADAAARAGTRATLWGALALLIGAIAAGVGGIAGRQATLRYRTVVAGVTQPARRG